MKKTEGLQKLAAASREKQLQLLEDQIEAVKQAKPKSVEEFTAILEPLAQAMAALVEETRQTLANIDLKAKEQSDTFSGQIQDMAKDWKAAAIEAKTAAGNLDKAAKRMEWRHYALTAATGVFSAVLVTAFMLWLVPQRPFMNHLDTAEVVARLKPALIEALKPSRSKHNP
jgi:acyl-CoA reductase-like NAD-dependent aldehyde dehydrogenase